MKIKRNTASLYWFLFGALFLGLNAGLMNSTFNNYLAIEFHIGATTRGALEFPREMPGFLLIFMMGLLSFMSFRQRSVLVGLCSAFGILGIGIFSPNIGVLTFWMILWSMGDHLWMPIESKMGLAFATSGKEGTMLGRITGIRHLSQVIGTVMVWIVFGWLFKNGAHVGYKIVYIIAFISGLLGAWTFWKMNNVHGHQHDNLRFIFRKKYSLFYLLNIFFGARKQLFLTFGPWLLIQRHNCPPEIIATLIFIGAICSYFFRRELGKMIDRWGERRVLFFDGIILSLIGLSYAISNYLPLLYITFILDYLMFAVRIAHTTYLKKIAIHTDDISPSISLGITLDHVVSMTIPILGGLAWTYFWPESVFWGAFVLGGCGALLSLKVRKLAL